MQNETEEQRAAFDEQKRKESEAFRAAADPLIKYLADNHHPHTQVTVTSVGAELWVGELTTGNVYDHLDPEG